MVHRIWFAALVAAGCGGGGVDTPAECNPLGGIGCVTPWPSTIYEVEAGTDTGMQLDLPVGALPATDDGVAYDPTGIDRKDGFSPAGFAFTAFTVRVDPANLVTWHDYAASLE